MSKAAALFLAFGAAVATSPALHAQPARTDAFPVGRQGGASIGQLFGRGRTESLVRSGDIEERLRGVERAAAARTPEGLAILIRCKENAECVADSRALLALVRGLAAWTERPAARAALVSIVRAPSASLSGRASTALIERNGQSPASPGRGRDLDGTS